ncbi:MAG: phosphatase PAP2 family protein [Gaiellaceae bacterium]
MTDLLQQLHQWDAFVLNAGEAVRCSPLTVVSLIASAWWVKGPLFVLIGACGDVRARRQFPVTASAAALSALAASIVSMALKEAFDRPRPGNAGTGVDPLVATPADPSFPSGHTLTAFAAAAVVSSFHPRLRWPLFALAATVGLSRIYLGVHFWLDVFAGAAAGVMVGLVAAWIARKVVWRIRAIFRGRSLARSR